MPDRDGLGLEQYYKDLYEKEVKKCEALTRELVTVEEENAELHRKVDALKNSFMFKLIKPFRNAWARTKNAFIRVKRYGNLRNIIAKLKSKRIERSAYKRYGTQSLPAEEERKATNGRAAVSMTESARTLFRRTGSGSCSAIFFGRNSPKSRLM